MRVILPSPEFSLSRLRAARDLPPPTFATMSSLVCFAQGEEARVGVNTESAQEHPRIRRFLSRFGSGKVGAEARPVVALKDADGNGGDDTSDSVVLREVDETLAKAKTLRADRNLNPYFAQQLQRYEEALTEGAEFLRDTRHSVAFIGDVGVGKTSMICGLTGLQTFGKNDKKKSALITGPGGTTVCEVGIGRGRRENRYALIVEPRGNDEIEAHVAEWSDYMTHIASPESAKSEGDKPRVPKEIDRAIRNMSGLPETRVAKPDGTRERVDPAKTLAAQFNDADKLRAEVLKRMALPQRFRTEAKGADKEWLRKNFADINDGKNPDFSIPERMEVVIPTHPFSDEEKRAGLEIFVVDTKGVDETAARADLARHFDDPRAVVVLCSGFAEAPGLAAQQHLERARDSGTLDIAEKTAILVLPHGDEATEKQRDEDDLSSEEAYEEKREDANKAVFALGVGDVPIEFYNVEKDEPGKIRAFFVARINGLRMRHRERLRNLNATVRSMMESRQKAEYWAQQGEAKRRLANWMNGREIDVSAAKIQDELLAEMRAIRYASSLRASVARSGMWHNFDYYNILGLGARKIAYSRIKKWMSDFNANADGIENDDNLSEAHGFVRAERQWLESACSELLQGVGRHCDVAFRETLAGEDAQSRLWIPCQDQWGRGPGYKHRVAGFNQSWFDREIAANTAKRVEEHFLNGWRDILDRLGKRLSVENPLSGNAG